MIDVNEITSTLRGMPDQQLQQYAAMHKGDPYILALAVSESNQRKKLRMAAQGQAGGQPMPKVVDQDIAAMAPQQLPENQGIGQLAAPNIQHMADGGIAGYGDDANEDPGLAMGGSMFDFAQRSEPVLRMAGGGAVPRYNGLTGSLTGDIPGFQNVQPRAQFTQQGAPENQTLWERFSDYMGEKKKQATLSEIEYRINQGIATPDEIALYNSAKIKAGDKAATEAKYPSNMAVRAKDFPGVTPGYEKVSADAAAPAPAPTPSAAPAPQATLPTGLPSLAQVKKMSDELYDTKDMKQMVEQQRLQQRQDITNQSEERAAKMAAFNKEQGPAFAGYEKLLQAEELQDATDKEKSGLMALMKGFLGMAAGESPNAATNIAKGAMAGLGEYTESLKEFKKAAKERNKAMADIENARRSEARGDFKSQQDYEALAAERLSKVDQHATDAVLSIMGKKGEGATNLAREMIQQSGANARTNLQVNAPSPQMQLYGALGGGDIKKGLGVYSEAMGPEAKGLQGLLAKYADPMKLELLKNTDPEMYNYVKTQMRMQMQPQPMSKPTGPVRD